MSLKKQVFPDPGADEPVAHHLPEDSHGPPHPRPLLRTLLLPVDCIAGSQLTRNDSSGGARRCL